MMSVELIAVEGVTTPPFLASSSEQTSVIDISASSNGEAKMPEIPPGESEVEPSVAKATTEDEPEVEASDTEKMPEILPHEPEVEPSDAKAMTEDEAMMPEIPPAEPKVEASDTQAMTEDEPKTNDAPTIPVNHEESNVEEIPRMGEEEPRIEIIKQVFNVVDGGAVQLPQPETLGLKLEWLGTSSCYIETGVQMQLQGHLDSLIAYRQALTKDRNSLLYHPGAYIGLAMVDNRLGFCDVAAGEGYRALVLCQSGLGIYKRKVNPSNLRQLVRDDISMGFMSKTGFARDARGVSDAIIDEELDILQLQAYKVILVAMIGCKTFYEGCLWARAALNKYLDEAELRELEKELKAGYADRLNNLKKEEPIDRADLNYLGKTGEIYQKPYPWMDKTLFYRTAEQIDAINNADITAAWEIKPVIFGPVSEQKDVQVGGDVGPLGMFAKRPIEEGEIFLVDKTFAGISNVSSIKGEHCDACHAVLVAPYISPSEIFRAQCCGKVSYCSQVCHDSAMMGYHRLLCKKEFDWVYNHHLLGKTGESRTNWQPILFLRMMAIVLADKSSFAHPLQHRLISRMAANYRNLAPGDLHGVLHNWQFWENVVAPTRILMELGVDIFLEEAYSPEVIQTIYWRLENNAHSGMTTLTGKEVHMTAINGQYLFINHSCNPNVSWHGTTALGSMDISWLKDQDGKLLRPGSSAVWCVAAKDIKKGEELKISYIGDPKGEMGMKKGDRKSKRARLAKWFDYGCGCVMCEEENKQGFEEENKQGFEMKSIL